ncbi:sugar transferase [Pseudenhygromyxa sp. WMMC2535]|uniref:sugar transferase n=1 Tax=Pseudenhygromyxa sp. WMMC2535 TaxID=2712867 RepID=UPI0015953C68|nr:sugar transferase [Pseudenhygromyxa sp. WMMC2535]NVB38232.1 sugar transferase [Pseudenhygromyxa sp. WMMC2535]NVB43587.1 sugar transferase [Pseudenhygromyxa sp. WMMC2535]
MPTVLVFLLDLLLAALAVECSGWLDREIFAHPTSTLGFVGTTVTATLASFSAALGAYLTGLNNTSLLLQPKQVVARVALVSLTTTLVALVVAYFVWYQPIGRVSLSLIGATSFVLLTSWRLLYARFIARGPRIGVALLGDGPVERRFALRLNSLAHTRYEVRGFIKADPKSETGPDTGSRSDEAIASDSEHSAPLAERSVVLGMPLPEGLVEPPVLGSLEHTVDICHDEELGHVVVVGATGLGEAQIRAMSQLQAQGVRVHTAGAMWMNVALQVPIDLVDARWVLNTFEQLDRPVVLASKRLVDLCVAGLGLLAFVPMAAVLWPLQKLLDPGPFFYTQDRVGAGGRIFRIYKIRTMRVIERSEQRWAAQDADRITGLGRLLRKTRIDEFPQFWNVLCGEMSLVGPRPEQPKIVEALERTIPFFAYRHLVKPGITGWAQIHQGYAASVDESALKLSYDLYYVGRLSILMDFDIMLRTAFVMAARIGSR